MTSLNPKALELQSSLKIPGLLESPMGSSEAEESFDLVGWFWVEMRRGSQWPCQDG